MKPCVDRLLVLVALAVCGCARAPPNFFRDPEKEATALFARIQVVSLQASARLEQEHPGLVNPDVMQRAVRHFERAEEIIAARASRRRSHSDGSMHEFLVELTKPVKPRLVVLSTPHAFALAFPDGTVAVSDTLVALYAATGDSYNAALLGIFLHEMVHVSDAHSLEQWMTAAGRKAYISDQVAAVVSALTIIVPGISLEYSAPGADPSESAEDMAALTEYAADSAVMHLLRLHGYEPEAYVASLRSMVGVSAPKEPFTWLSKRVQCLERSSAPTLMGVALTHGGIVLGGIDVEAILLQAKSDDADDKTIAALFLYMTCSYENALVHAERLDGFLVAPYATINLFMPI